MVADINRQRLRMMFTIMLRRCVLVKIGFFYLLFFLAFTVLYSSLRPSSISLVISIAGLM